MHRPAEAHRREFDELGYTVFEGLLAPVEIDAAVRAIDALITFDSRAPLVTSTSESHRNGRRQLRHTSCEPSLAALGSHPRVVEAVERLTGRPYGLFSTPIPVVTFRSEPGGENFGWGYHVDWMRTPPREDDLDAVFGLLHLSRVDTGGGAFMLIPGSHRVVADALGDAALRERAFSQRFEGFPGLGEREELRVRAGDLLLFHPLLVHDRSENLLEQPRKGVFVHYKPRRRRDAEEAAKSFHADHLATMDQRTRVVCGVE